MIDKNKIKEIVEAYLAAEQKEDLFLVEVKVSKANVITVAIDGDNGVKVDDCISLSRHIESQMDRDKEDFELTVMSFGLEEYFTMPRQFVKNVSQNIEVIDKEGERRDGVLAEADNEFILITTKKDKEGVRLPYADIEKARVIIKF
ncbi:MAG: ribosome assembly cofactor RimP [Bacteroidales bacterium]|nr:ribosome assembly cofactor RimP [Candidatus Scybalousia scybalohippi]